jgi:hypothetical protein
VPKALFAGNDDALALRRDIVPAVPLIEKAYAEAFSVHTHLIGSEERPARD